MKRLWIPALLAASLLCMAQFNPAIRLPFLTVEGDLTVNGECIGCGGSVTGAFTASFTNAGTTTPTLDFEYAIIGGTVFLTWNSLTGTFTSDTTSFATDTGAAPAAIRPATAAAAGFAGRGLDNNSSTALCLLVFPNGVIEFRRSSASGYLCSTSEQWTNIGNKRGPDLLGGIIYNVN